MMVYKKVDSQNDTSSYALVDGENIIYTHATERYQIEVGGTWHQAYADESGQLYINAGPYQGEAPENSPCQRL